MRRRINGALLVLRRGDLVKSKRSGGHVMTVTQVAQDGQSVIASYSTPDGIRHDIQWRTNELKKVNADPIG